MKLNQNIVHIELDYQFFIGQFDNNQMHQHYAVQLSIPLNNAIKLSINQTLIQTEEAVLIKPNITHQLDCEGVHLLILFNPASTVGHYWNRLITSGFLEVNSEPVKRLKKLVKSFLAEEISVKDLIEKVIGIVESYDCHCDSFVHSGDDRIDKAIAYLRTHHKRVIPLEEVAAYCNLSASRFLHLFKENTGITYRRAQLWVKLMAALPLMSSMTLTEIAHEVGFADSAHFSRIFKENFGFSPKTMVQLSQFVQV